MAYPVIGNSRECLGLEGEEERDSNFANVGFELLLRYPSDDVR